VRESLCLTVPSRRGGYRELDLRLSEAHASDSSRPSPRRRPTPVSVRIAADADLIAVSRFGVLAILPGMQPESTPQRLGHLRILLSFRRGGKPQSVRTDLVSCPLRQAVRYDDMTPVIVGSTRLVSRWLDLR
jgi:hypothetical protein